ncbi:hypothetical protein [Idiomarina sp.]|uniref:hypothetical protein n=1 Tax=Idiomarina sp. TaxID=1874361 RepID=UPI002635437D|nr:hypothetical protein [Idiomarina sp.]
MTKVFEGKLLKLREELTEQLTSSEVDIDTLEQKVEVYCSLLPDYSDELHKHLSIPDVQEAIKKELLFAEHVTSALDGLKSDRKNSLLTLNKGRKAKSKY